MPKITLRTTVKMLGLLFIPAVFCCLFVPQTVAAIGLSVGNSALNLGQTENLFYGNIGSASHASSSFLLLQKNSADIFKIDNFGNLNTPGTITAGGFVGPIIGGSISADNVSSGDFGSNYGGGDYSFPGNVNLNGNRVNIGGNASAASFHYGTTGLMYKKSTGTRSLMEIHSPNGTGKAVLQVLDGGSFYIQSLTASPTIFGNNYAGSYLRIDGSAVDRGIRFSSTGGTAPVGLGLSGSALQVTNGSTGLGTLIVGNVGIGTPTPNALLDIYNGALVNRTAAINHYRNVLMTYLGTGAQTGALKIVLPKQANTMIDITIKGYNYNSIGSWEVRVSGYVYAGTGGGWYTINHNVQIIGSAPFSQVRLAYDGSKPVILLGNTSTVWSYGSVEVTDVITSFSSITDWGTGWTASLVTSETGLTIIATPTIYTYMSQSGNFGIGTTNPTTKLYINAGTGDAVNVGGGRIRGLNTTPINADEAVPLTYLQSNYAPSASDLWSGTKNGNIWNGDSGTGNVGIGITAPAQKLDIAGAIKIANTSSTCDSTQTGTFKYDNISGQSYLCNGKYWINQNNCGLMVDEDGNSYGTVQIGGQCWITENIRVGTMLASGATMPVTTDQVIEKWCYNNLPAECETNGGLYHWDEAMRGSQVAGARGICASGWHIPTDAEYNILEKTVVGIINSSASQYNCDLSYSGWQRCADNTGTNGAGQSLKKVGIGSGVGAGNDLVGFAATLPGYRNTNASFGSLGSTLALWSSTPSSASNAWRRALYTSYSTVYRAASNKALGFSVRCLKD